MCVMSAWYFFLPCARDWVDLHDTPESSGCGAPWAGWGYMGGGRREPVDQCLCLCVCGICTRRCPDWILVDGFMLCVPREQYR
jgi:hypothetical protein